MNTLARFDEEKWPALAWLRVDRKIMMPGLSFWLPRISPKVRKDAWTALRDKRVQTMLHKHPQQVRQFFLSDDCCVADKPQLSVAFAQKDEKEHLTLTEDGKWVLEYLLLPVALRAFLADCYEFIEAARTHIDDILPPAVAGKTCLKARLFNYASSDLLVGLKPNTEVPIAMRPHVDGSLFTAVVAESDGCLRVHGPQGAIPVQAHDHRAFGVLMPGVAAWRDYRLYPTPHSVLPAAEGRASLTVFVTPDLGRGKRKLAISKLAAWDIPETASVAA